MWLGGYFFRDCQQAGQNSRRSSGGENPDLQVKKIIDPANIVSLDTPVIVCEQFGCFNVCVIQVAVAHMAGRNASEVLVASASEIFHPPSFAAPDGKQLRSDQRLYNDLLGKLLTKPRSHTQ